jgi:hypothetical protein
VLGNRLLRRIFGPKRGKEYGTCRKLHNEKFHYLDSSTSIIITIKSRICDGNNV